MNLLKKKQGTHRRVARKVTDAITHRPKTTALAGLAAAGAVGAAAWMATHRDGDGIALHVDKDEDGAWRLRREGVDKPLQLFPNKKQAVSAAREYARDHGPSMLTIHKEDGAVSGRHVYAKA